MAKRRIGRPREKIPDPKTLAGRVAMNIVKARGAKGLSVDQISERAGVGRVTWYRLESGELATFDAATLQRVADALGVDASALFQPVRRK